MRVDWDQLGLEEAAAQHFPVRFLPKLRDRVSKALRLIHYRAWLAQRWHDPIFPINFPWFGSSDYWKGQVDMLEEQNEAMQESPLVV